ncbi:PGF-CTERM sorting domain-containing protein [Haloglomus irregulare]|uniref:PGF-CTERM sorting domain-containing protein n=1 Tax=Haloglomus irregulare TaxID=2234134 RepID=A0A554NEN0_9EURY|nr:PGF-CTERM sorting domain-containing protein [Haloglomus irregulare]TSD15843.1 PGF-CTERM sorting domain-containing protein [Haloglomus irregulare]
MHRRMSVLVVAVALVVAGATAGVTGAVGATSTDAESDDASAVSTESTALTHVASVSISNQTSGGTVVTVEEVYVPDGGFVTIHDERLAEGGEGVLSSVRGSSQYLSPGNHSDVRVRLNDPIRDDSAVIAMPHRDSDGDRAYEFVSGNAEVDGPYTADGEIVTDSATVTASATVSISDQPTDGTTVLVDRTELANGGFVTIHDSSVLDGATFESVRGSSEKLDAGIHSDIRITLDEPLENDDTVVAMPHRDTDDDGSYDFVTSDGGDDGPYTDADGSIVTDAGSAVLTDTADVTMADDVSGGNLVTVDEVFLPNGGFVTAHDGNVSEDALGSVRGTSEYLGPGYHETVHIVLDDPFTGDNATVVPMAHTDTNNNEQYDFVRSEGRNDGPYTDDNGAVIDQATLDIAAGFHVDTQPSDGVTVTVDHVDLSEDGYVTIHDSSLNAGEVTGSVRGSSAYLEAGYYDSVTITLDDPLRQSTTVIPMAHRETDGDESYDFVTSEGADDGPVTTSEGELVIDSATATVLSQVSFEPQTTSDTNVTVQSATLHDGGFVTIHDASLLEGAVFDSVRGTSEYLGPGTHEDVTVALDEFEESSTLIAMPHLDTNGNQQYDFVASEGANDGPYVAKDIVVAPAMVDVSGMGQGSARVTLNNQTANGAAGSVTVSSATLPEGGFLTIHDGTLLDGDALGSVRGTSDYLEAGDHSDIEVSLDEPYTASGSIIAMPHRDTNGNEAYDFVSSEGEADAPYTTSDDEIVLDPAALTVRSASVDFEDQETDGDSVTVASVTMSQGGFVTIHDDTVGDDAIGSVVGTSDYLAAGQSSNVEVDVDISASGQYFAMPHLDTNDNEAYDFVSSEGSADGPYTTEGGDIVLAGAQVTVEESGGDGTETGGQPGFGAVVAVLALLGAALLARRS